MNEHTFRIAEIEVAGSTADERITALLRFEADGKGRKSPLVLVIAEITSTLYVYEQLLDAVSEAVDQTLPMITEVGGDPMARFEKLVERLNAAIDRFVQREPSQISWNRVNMFVLECAEGRVCLTGIGRLANIFLQKQADGSWKSFDVFGSLEQPAEIDPKKVFASLMCGELKAGDQLFAGTNNFDRWRGDLGLIERMQALPAVSAAEEVKSELLRLNLPEDFAALIVSRVDLPSGPKGPPGLRNAPPAEPPKSTTSVERLHTEEKKTQSLLGPSIAPVQADVPKAAVAKGGSGFSFVKLAAEARARLKSMLSGRRDPLAVAGLRGLSAGQGGFTPARQRLLIGVVAALVVFGVLGGWFYYAQRVKAEQELWNAVYDQAADKKNRAEADLVYGNEDRTRRLLQEAQDTVNGLDEKNQDRKNAKAKLTQEIRDVLDKLKRELKVEKPELLASLAVDAPSGALQGLAVWNGKLYAADNAGKAMLEVEPSSKAVKRIDIPSDAGDIVSLSPGASALYVLTSSKKLFSMNASGVFTALALPSGNKLQSAKDLYIYNARFYLLDPSANMIWRYSPTGNALGQETPYLKQTSQNLAGATGLAIDASVYVSFENGTVKKYLSGAEEAWTLSAAEPAVGNAADVWTSSDAERVLIADAAGKRILVYRKDGRLINQITSPEFKGPVAVFGDPAAKKLYVIDANRVYRFDLP